MFMISNSYNAICYYGLKIYQHLTKVAFVHLHEQRAKELNKQISLALILQVIRSAS